MIMSVKNLIYFEDAKNIFNDLYKMIEKSDIYASELISNGYNGFCPRKKFFEGLCEANNISKLHSDYFKDINRALLHNLNINLPCKAAKKKELYKTNLKLENYKLIGETPVDPMEELENEIRYEEEKYKLIIKRISREEEELNIDRIRQLRKDKFIDNVLDNNLKFNVKDRCEFITEVLSTKMERIDFFYSRKFSKLDNPIMERKINSEWSFIYFIDNVSSFSFSRKEKEKYLMPIYLPRVAVIKDGVNLYKDDDDNIGKVFHLISYNMIEYFSDAYCLFFEYDKLLINIMANLELMVLIMPEYNEIMYDHLK